MVKSYCFSILFFITLNNSVIAWTGSFQKLDGGVDNVAVASWGPGRCDVFGADKYGAIWIRSWSDVWSKWNGWSSIGGKTFLKPSAFSIAPGLIHVMYTGEDKKLYVTSWNERSASQKWTPWTAYSKDYETHFSSGPALAGVERSNILHIFVLGLGGEMLHGVYFIDSQSWSVEFEHLGGQLVGDPAAVSWGQERYDAFGIASDEQIWQITYDKGWSSWKNIHKGSKFKPGLGASSKEFGSINLFARGKDDALHHSQFENGNWGAFENLGGGLKGSPAATSLDSFRADVVVVGSDSAVYLNTWDSNKNKRNFGCLRGYCWLYCDNAPYWCFSSKNNKIDEYTTCEHYGDCSYSWKCAGYCSI